MGTVCTTRTPHLHWPAGQISADVMHAQLNEHESAKKKATELRTQDSQRKSFCFSWSSLLTSSSYVKLFVIVSRTIGVFLVEIELSR